MAYNNEIYKLIRKNIYINFLHDIWFSLNYKVLIPFIKDKEVFVSFVLNIYL